MTKFSAGSRWVDLNNLNFTFNTLTSRFTQDLSSIAQDLRVVVGVRGFAGSTQLRNKLILISVSKTFLSLQLKIYGYIFLVGLTSFWSAFSHITSSFQIAKFYLNYILTYFCQIASKIEKRYRSFFWYIMQMPALLCCQLVDSFGIRNGICLPRRTDFSNLSSRKTDCSPKLFILI